jgi:hypothetical protein
MNKLFLYGFVMLGTVSLIGCGQKELPTKKTYSVGGKVQIKGEPAAFVILHFKPVGGGFPATGYTDKDGTIIGARSFTNTDMDGVVAGEYEVTIEGYDAATFMGPKPGEEEKPAEVSPEVAKEKKTVTVEASDGNQLNIEF